MACLINDIIIFSIPFASGNSNVNNLTDINPETDSSGVVNFMTVVPGHYTGRTNHIHIMASLDATLLGVLLDKVETVAPYALNTQEKLRNSNDNIFSEEVELMNPVPEYILLNVTYTLSLVVILTENGGVVNADSGMGGPGGAPGSAPSSISASSSSSATVKISTMTATATSTTTQANNTATKTTSAAASTSTHELYTSILD
ncbi:hypothetical protein M422DRAFT_55550 [Sphaerobolus stellatus SS14]|uniref:Unplaced genomic scaffold SPHSTscaffold_295, whole genome shotgun sequence n=1 Tax=Sphaerobolus stellatus (strain SS14) TaxID=990650 RepID=A0A0C9ULX5_SPHS4|nr:hypothetical protein M422DRAFT_55550 [Sphaerobolus stellatus SS14]